MKDPLSKESKEFFSNTWKNAQDQPSPTYHDFNNGKNNYKSLPLEFSITKDYNGNIIGNPSSQSKNILDQFPDNPYDAGWQVYKGLKGILGLPSPQRPPEAMPGTPEYNRQQNNPHRELPPFNIPQSLQIHWKGLKIEFQIPLDSIRDKLSPDPKVPNKKR